MILALPATGLSFTFWINMRTKMHVGEIDKADEDLGLVTGTKLSGYQIRMTVIVQPRGEKQLDVRSR